MQWARTASFSNSLGRLSPRFHAPAAAILLQGVLASLFAVSNRYDELVGYAVFADWIFFALAGVALIVFRRTMPKPRARGLFHFTRSRRYSS